MEEKSYQFLLTDSEAECLEQLPAAAHRPQLYIVTMANGSRALTKVKQSEAEALREALTEELAKVGFDKDYAVTAKGRTLEALIDKLLLP